jgi:hypothetical protein
VTAKIRRAWVSASRRAQARPHTEPVRQTFAHDAVLVMEPGGDPGAPGAAITVALCGHWDHEPPCPLAPHHTAVSRRGDEVCLRVLFAAEPDVEAEVRRRIETALTGPAPSAPDGRATRWRLLSSRPGVVRPEETDHARRILVDAKPGETH